MTYAASLAFQPPSSVPRADQVSVRGARLPYFKFNRQPHVPFPDVTQNMAPKIKPVQATGQSPAAAPKDVHRIEVFNASVAAQLNHPNRKTTVDGDCRKETGLFPALAGQKEKGGWGRAAPRAPQPP